MSLMVSWGVLMYYLHNKGKSFFFSEIVEFPLFSYFFSLESCLLGEKRQDVFHLCS